MANAVRPFSFTFTMAEMEENRLKREKQTALDKKLHALCAGYEHHATVSDKVLAELRALIKEGANPKAPIETWSYAFSPRAYRSISHLELPEAMLSCLLEHGADPNQKDSRNTPPVSAHLAQKLHYDLVICLLRWGADINQVSLKYLSTSTLLMTALHEAKQGCYQSPFHCRKQWIQMIQILLIFGAQKKFQFGLDCFRKPRWIDVTQEAKNSNEPNIARIISEYSEYPKKGLDRSQKPILFTQIQHDALVNDPEVFPWHMGKFDVGCKCRPG